MQSKGQDDWGIKSSVFDQIKEVVGNKHLESDSEAQTRFDIIDRLIKEVFGWEYGQISVEERQEEAVRGYVDYILRAGDIKVVIEAKKIGVAFPSPTRARRLKLNGAVLSAGDIGKSIKQALEYSKSKVAQITVITNGLCWCFLQTDQALSSSDAEAALLFPFEDYRDAEELFRLFSNKNISANGTALFSSEIKHVSENKLIKIVRDSELRVGRNNVADYIAPALDSALHSENIINNPDFLKSCFVYTTNRQKFDTTLSMHLVDNKPISIAPAKRLRHKRESSIETLVKYGKPESAPPVTLLIGGVGVGKSTYLRHYELVSGKDTLTQKKAHWVYIDFESMGRGNNVRNFLYQKLKEYLLDTKKEVKTDFKEAIEPAYKSDIDGLKTGIYSLISDNDEKFKDVVTKYIEKDFNETEPFVDKLFKYISKQQLCIIVLDNTDLYEDEELEKSVLSEGLALAKKLFCHVVISIRDVTYINHKHDSIFDAFELKTLWLDPPPFREVLSKRLTLSSLILKGHSASISASNGISFRVPDLSVFFEIVQKSLLAGKAGDFLEAFADLNIRKGLLFTINFLNSGHIHADKALNIYITGADADYLFPFHEIFKGCVLGQWMYFKETRCDCINLFDSKLGSENLKMLRLCILAHLYTMAKNEGTAKVSAGQCIKIFSTLGANSSQIIRVLNDLIKYGLIKTTDATTVSEASTLFITRAGGYHFIKLSCTLPYVESCLYDTAVDNLDIWNKLSTLTHRIEAESDTKIRMELRKERFDIFINYIDNIEKENLKLLEVSGHPPHIERICAEVGKEFEGALRAVSRRVYKR